MDLFSPPFLYGRLCLKITTSLVTRSSIFLIFIHNFSKKTLQTEGLGSVWDLNLFPMLIMLLRAFFALHITVKKKASVKILLTCNYSERKRYIMEFFFQWHQILVAFKFLIFRTANYYTLQKPYFGLFLKHAKHCLLETTFLFF